jgi:hypothetical protein
VFHLCEDGEGVVLGLHDGAVLFLNEGRVFRAGGLPVSLLSYNRQVVCLSSGTCWVRRHGLFERFKNSADSGAVVDGMLALADRVSIQIGRFEGAELLKSRLEASWKGEVTLGSTKDRSLLLATRGLLSKKFSKEEWTQETIIEEPVSADLQGDNYAVAGISKRQFMVELGHTKSSARQTFELASKPYLVSWLSEALLLVVSASEFVLLRAEAGQEGPPEVVLHYPVEIVLGAIAVSDSKDLLAVHDVLHGVVLFRVNAQTPAIYPLSRYRQVQGIAELAFMSHGRIVVADESRTLRVLAMKAKPQNSLELAELALEGVIQLGSPLLCFSACHAFSPTVHRLMFACLDGSIQCLLQLPSSARPTLSLKKPPECPRALSHKEWRRAENIHDGKLFCEKEDQHWLSLHTTIDNRALFQP